jgi:chromosome segregation ATPase
MMDADTLAVELALKDEELSRLRDSIERERRKMEGEIVSLKFDLQKVRNEVNVREGKMASIKLELEKGRKRVEAIELERRTLEQEAARATEAAAESDRLRAEAENAERAARAECEEFARRVAVADAEVARLRDVHEEATRALAAQAQAQAAGGTNREAIRQVEERVGLLRQEWERLRENERNLTNGTGVDTGAGVDADHGARWAVEEFVRELQGRVGRLEREKEEEKALQREVKDELHRRIRKLERERDDERERTREALDRARGLDDQLRAAVDAAERERADRRRAEEASAQLGERLAQYEALGRGEVERGQHLFLDREKELRQAVEERESQRRKIEAEVIMLRVELQRVQAQAAEAGSLAAELADVRGQLAQAKLESHQRYGDQSLWNLHTHSIHILPHTFGIYTHSREVEHQAKVEGLEERMRVWEERHDPQAREREVEEARAKDRRIAQLTAELAAQAQLVASQQEMHENSLQALKTQNSLLSREVPHIIAYAHRTHAHTTRTRTH